MSFDSSNNSATINVEMDGSAFEEQSSFNMLELSFSSKLDWDSYTASITKTASKKIGVLVRSMKFLSSEVALYLSNLPYGLPWNLVVTSGLVLPVATWMCWISYREGLLVLHMVPLLNPWLIVEM